MPVPTRERAEHMARRLLRTARRNGVRAPERLAAAFRRAMEPRHGLLDDDHDPRYLHPGRTALVLMNDAGVTEAGWLMAAVFAETVSPELAWRPPDDGRRDLDGDLRAALERARDLPGLGAPDLAERLVTAPAEATLLALSEYLDQLRHLRLWADDERVRSGNRVAERILVPVAHRTHPVLARRLAWWVRRGISAS